jgi:hypothetical protein
MAKEYWLKFGTGNPTDTSGLSPTLTIFRSWTGGVLVAPGITQPIASYGLYRFEYTPSFPIVFVADGATTGLSAASRYLSGTLDPLDLVDERLSEVGTTLLSIGVSNTVDLTPILDRLGTTASSFGSTSVDPGTVYGFLKRLQELQEGDASFNKTTGVWSIQTRGGTLLQEKTVTNGANTVTKT